MTMLTILISSSNDNNFKLYPLRTIFDWINWLGSSDQWLAMWHMNGRLKHWQVYLPFSRAMTWPSLHSKLATTASTSSLTLIKQPNLRVLENIGKVYFSSSIAFMFNSRWLTSKHLWSTLHSIQSTRANNSEKFCHEIFNYIFNIRIYCCRYLLICCQCRTKVSKQLLQIVLSIDIMYALIAVLMHCVGTMWILLASELQLDIIKNTTTSVLLVWQQH